MTEIIAGGVAGLLLGLAAQGMGMGDRQQVQESIALRSRGMLRATLYALGLGTMLTAFLGWLAVIDVDLLTVLPLHGGIILGAVVFGTAAGLTGVTLGGALTMTGGGRFLEGLCAVIGCLAGAAALPWLGPVMTWAQTWFPAMEQTLFRVTLDGPYLWSGGFLGQACLGAVLAALAVILGSERKEEPAAQPESRDVPPVSTDAEEVREETVVATLPGEEPVVVDTAAPEEADAPVQPGTNQPESDDDAAGQDAPEDAGDVSAAPEVADAPVKPGENQPESDDDAAGQDAPEDAGDASTTPEVADAPVKPGENQPKQDAEAAGQDSADPPPEPPTDKNDEATEEIPVMMDHPELDTPPEDTGDWTEQMARLEEDAGQGTPVQEEALPVGARAVGEPERREEPKEDEHLG